MRSSDEIRAFYFEALDATNAFEYRLNQAVNSQDNPVPNYARLLSALKHLTLKSAISFVVQDRDKIVSIACCSRLHSSSRRIFLWELLDVVKASGDVELAAIVTCSYILESVNSTFLKLKAYEPSLRLLKRCRDNPIISPEVRAEAALTMARILLKYGCLVEATGEVWKASRLTRKSKIWTRSFEIIGDINMARGMFERASRKYEQAMKNDGGVEPSLRIGSVLAQKWAIAKMKTGRRTIVFDETNELFLRSDWETNDPVVLTCFMLEMCKSWPSQHAYNRSLMQYNALKRMPTMWRECCRLSITIADYLIEIGWYEKSEKYLEYVFRLSKQYENPTDMIDALLLWSQACWYQGRFGETLVTARRIRKILRGQPIGPKFALTQLLRAKLTLYERNFVRSVRLLNDTYALFAKWGRIWESLEVIRLFCSLSIWQGKPNVAIKLLSVSLPLQFELLANPNERLRSCVVLVSAYYEAGKPNDAETWLKWLGRTCSINILPQTLTIRNLAESEASCYQQNPKKAKQAAESAIEYAKEIGNKLLQALCYYQFIKAIVLNGETEKVEGCLDNARCEYPFGERLMWQPVSKIFEKKELAFSDFKPIGAFPF